ncbi:LOW QUALITY PROTEIN: hypothetical protein HID58_095190, partial [Brassica napus]
EEEARYSLPAARIKKIMQADEDVGKIALAVPVLVSKSLELFLQDLCDRTYEITLERGAKTVSSLHLKHCVERYNVFDFLRKCEQVPDYGQAQGQAHGTGDVTMDDRTISKRRKPISDEVNDSDEENKKSKTRWGMLSPVAGVVEGEDEEEVAVERAAKAAERKSEPRDACVSVITTREREEGCRWRHCSIKRRHQAATSKPKEGIDIDLNAESLDLNETKPAPVPAADKATTIRRISRLAYGVGQDRSNTVSKFGIDEDEDEEDYDEEG